MLFRKNGNPFSFNLCFLITFMAYIVVYISEEESTQQDVAIYLAGNI